MPMVPVQIPAGVVRGATPNDVPNRWWSTNLVRWSNNVLEPVGGWQRVTSSPLSSLVRRFHVWRSDTNVRHIMAGTETEMLVDVDGTWTDVAPVDLSPLSSGEADGFGVGDYGEEDYGDARSTASPLYDNRSFWTFDNWGEDLLAVASSDGRLLYYDVTNPSTAARAVGVTTISTATRATNVTTAVTATPHGLTSGQSATIAGVTDNSFDQTNATVTVTDDTTFTYPNTGPDGSSTGGTVTDNTIPTSSQAVVVTDERHVFLIAAGGNKRRIAWSSREDQTDWDFSSTTNTAGFIDLQSTTSLFTGCKVREGVLVFSQTEVFLSRYIGLPFIYNSERIGRTALYGANTLATFDGAAFWFDGESFRLFRNGSMDTVPCPVLDYITANICPLYGPSRAHMSYNGTHQEVWFFYPAQGCNECDSYVVWSPAEGWWSIGSLARTAMYPAGAYVRPYAAGDDGHIYEHEIGWTNSGVSRVGDVYAETSALQNPDRSVEVKQAEIGTGYGYDKIKVRMYTNWTPEGAETSWGPYTPRSDGYTDTRVTGKDLRIRIENAQDADWSVGQMRLDITPGSRR